MIIIMDMESGCRQEDAKAGVTAWSAPAAMESMESWGRVDPCVEPSVTAPSFITSVSSFDARLQLGLQRVEAVR